MKLIQMIKGSDKDK